MDRTGDSATAAREPPGRSSPADPHPFARVVEAEHGRALRLAYLLAGDRDAAEDAVAEAFARTFPKWQAGTIDQVGPYLRRAVHNEVRNQRRAMGRQRSHEQRRRADERGPATPAGQTTTRHVVLELLDRLPHRQRAAIVLRYYADCSEAETAAALGCRPGTVKSLVARGLAALRDHADWAGLDGADAGEAA